MVFRVVSHLWKLIVYEVDHFLWHSDVHVPIEKGSFLKVKKFIPTLKIVEIPLTHPNWIFKTLPWFSTLFPKSFIC